MKRVWALIVPCLWVGAVSAQTVTAVSIDKAQQLEQVSATGVVIGPVSTPCVRCPFQVTSIVAGTGLSTLTPPTLAGPIDSAGLGAAWNGGRYFLATWDQNWHFGSENDWSAATRAELDARFGSGTYTITVNGTPVTLDLSGDTYPNTPILSLTGGEWRDGKYVIDPARTLGITTNTFTDHGPHPEDAIFIHVFGFGYVQANGNSPNTLSHTIPANTFVDGNEYRVWASFVRVSDWKSAVLGTAYAPATYTKTTSATIKAERPQRFPVQVSAQITPTISNATATFQPKPQDVGTTANVYVFAVAPATKVVNAAKSSEARLGMFAKGTAKADQSVPCVLAQLNASGQLQAVSVSNLAAYVTSVLSANPQSIPVLTNIPTPGIAGSTFYVGYGASAQHMITNGVNQRLLDIAGDVACDPQPPRTGWWWNTLEDGRGYSIEASGEQIFFAAYLYDLTGRATWTIASGKTSLDGALFSGRLESYASGQTLAGAYRAPAPVTLGGDITLAFSDGARGTLSWPGGSIPIERFNIVPGGLGMSAKSGQPEAGWWWNPQESGRGFFLEWQNGQLFMAGYMYDEQGSPIWYLATDVTPPPNVRSFAGQWWQFANGATLTGAYRPATRINDNVAPVTIQFSGPDTGIVTLPGGRTTAITRYRF